MVKMATLWFATVYFNTHNATQQLFWFTCSDIIYRLKKQNSKNPAREIKLLFILLYGWIDDSRSALYIHIRFS